MVYELNPTRGENARRACVDELITEHAQHAPARVAVVDEDVKLSYAELEARANQLARYLVARGVGDERRVGVMVERGAEMVVALLGVLKAGGVYVPMDGNYPVKRLKSVVDDAGVELLIVDAQTAGVAKELSESEMLNEQRALEVVCLDTQGERIAQESKEALERRATPENTACLIYTSGSSGTPKGVIISHSHWNQFVRAVRAPLEISENDVCLHSASVMFVVSLRQMLVPLCAGATIVIAKTGQVKDPLDLFALIKRQNVTTIDLVPSYWRSCIRALSDLETEAKLNLLDNKLRQIVSGGEPLPYDIPRDWSSKIKRGVRLLNAYGQTESAGMVAVYPIPSELENKQGLVPVGRPIANTQIHVLDAQLNPVPTGATGELYIGGDGVGRGYHNQAELTAERFMTDSFRDEAGARLYKTGDMGRRLADGNLMYAGRVDHQVKVRGFRVELGEVEAELAAHPSVYEAVVMLREDVEGENRLVAYIVMNDVTNKEDAPTTGELRRYLGRHLPDYMIPAAFIVLEELPRTSSGKVNRAKLPAPEQAQVSELSDEGIHLSSQSEEQTVNGLFYIPTWVRSAPPALLENEEQSEQDSCWLVFVDETGLGVRVAEQLTLNRQDVFTVRAGGEFARLGERAFIINPQRREDYDALLKELKKFDKSPGKIVHLWSVIPNIQSADEIYAEESQHLGFYSLLYLAQALGKNFINGKITLGIVSNNLQQVGDEDVLRPERATLLGTCKVIPLEYAGITCRSIDVAGELNSRHSEQLVEQIIAEMKINSSESIVAYRGKHRWVQTYQPIKLPQAQASKTGLRQNGVYLITGGLGGIGLDLAEHLARTVQAKLVLISRSIVPAKNVWAQWLAAHDESDEQSRKIRKLQLLEELGAEVFVAAADVTDAGQMRDLVRAACERFGTINGVIHAAGIRGVFEEIQDKQYASAAAVLAPKVKGTIILQDALQHINLDFLVLCSSLAAVLGRFCQVDYCAANAFQDSYAYCNAPNIARTISINWCTWRDVGMALDENVPFALKSLLEAGINQGISSQTGVDAFERIVSQSLPQVIVSTENLQFKINRQHDFAAPNSTEKNVKTESAAADVEPNFEKQINAQRTKLGNEHVAARDDVERVIASIWQELLHLERVGVNDNFFELGGHSLILTQLISRLRTTFKIELPIRKFFESPSVAGLAAVVSLDNSREQIAAPLDSQETIELLERIAELSETEASELLFEKESDERLQRTTSNQSIDVSPSMKFKQQNEAVRNQVVSHTTPADYYCCVEFDSFPAGEDSQLVYARRDGITMTLPTRVCEMLRRCQTLRTLDAHAHELRREFAPNDSTSSFVENSLAALVEAKLLVPATKFLDVAIKSSSADNVPPQITTVGLVTFNRLAAAKRALHSYIENAKQFGRNVEFVVIDDSDDRQTREAYREMLRSAKNFYGVEISYAGLEEKRAFAAELVNNGDFAPEIIEFALFDPENCQPSHGANHNALLLQTIGEMFFNPDDDTVCRVAAATPERNLKLTYNSDPARYNFFPNREAVVQSLDFVERDVLATHEQLLGKNLGDIINQSSELDLEKLDKRFLERLEANPRAKVSVTFNGLYGDCMWGTPFGYWSAPKGYLWMEQDSHEELVQTEADYRRACGSREMIRVVNRPCISDDTYCMAGLWGLDNRGLLPPFMPVKRGEGIIFGTTLWKCFADSYFGHLPLALLHAPVEARRFWAGEIFRSASGIDTARLIIEGIKSSDFNSSDFNNANLDGRESLRSLGEHLITLGSMSPKDFNEFVRLRLWRTNGEFIALLEGRLQMKGEAPDFWARDVKKYLAILRESQMREDYGVPLDLTAGRDVSEARQLAQRLVYKFGQLLFTWTDIVEATRDMRLRGRRLAQPI